MPECRTRYLEDRNEQRSCRNAGISRDGRQCRAVVVVATAHGISFDTQCRRSGVMTRLGRGRAAARPVSAVSDRHRLTRFGAQLAGQWTCADGEGERECEEVA